MVSSSNPTTTRPVLVRKKVTRKDPEKRKEQNRQSQKTYREKQRRRMEELERRAAMAPAELPLPHIQVAGSPGPTVHSPTSIKELPPANRSSGGVTEVIVGPQESVDPSLLLQQLPAADTMPLHGSAPSFSPSLETCPYVASLPLSSALLVDRHASPADADFHFLSAEFDRWLHDGSYTFASPGPSPATPPSSGPSSSSSKEMSAAWTTVACTCPGGHAWKPLGVPASYRAPPLRSSSPTPSLSTRGNLRIDMWCALSAMLENCLHLGITKAMFCADDSQSPFFHITNHDALTTTNDAIHQGGTGLSDSQLARHVRSIHGAIKYDLRPIDDQILRSHHPYIDILPFRDLRRNLIACQHDIDEDEFIIDFLTNTTCWGGGSGGGSSSICNAPCGGAGAPGSPWDSRSWEANEKFLQKWWSIVGGEDGELTRTSRWWREMRGERVTEVF